MNKKQAIECLEVHAEELKRRGFEDVHLRQVIEYLEESISLAEFEEVKKITCKAKINGEWVEVPFRGVFQYSDVIAPSPMIGGHKGGTIAYPVAVVELDNQLIMRNIDSVKDIKEVEE